MQIHVARDGKQLGVFSVEEIRQQLAAGTLSLSDLGWYEGAAGWAPLSSVPGVTTTAGATPPATSTPPASALAPITTTAGSAMALPQRKTETLAVLSLIFSIAGLTGFCCGFFLLAAIG